MYLITPGNIIHNKKKNLSHGIRMIISTEPLKIIERIFTLVILKKRYKNSIYIHCPFLVNGYCAYQAMPPPLPLYSRYKNWTCWRNRLSFLWFKFTTTGEVFRTSVLKTSLIFAKNTPVPLFLKTILLKHEVGVRG